MRHWTHLGDAPIPGTRQTLRLMKGKDDFAIYVTGGHELMNTRSHGSEDALGRLPVELLGPRPGARMLIGGLGMGFTLAAALERLPTDASVTVAELVPEVVEWNHGPLGEASGNPLSDPRTRIVVGDVADVLRRSPASFDIVALDVDNGPEGLTSQDNDDLYTIEGIQLAQRALKPGAVLAYWSAGPDRAFESRLRKCGFKVQTTRVYAYGNKGTRHWIWLCRG